MYTVINLVFSQRCHKGRNKTNVYTGSVDSIVDTSELVYDKVLHLLNLLRIGHVHLEHGSGALAVGGILLALFSCYGGILLVNVFEDNGFGSGLRNRESGLFPRCYLLPRAIY